jgi:hypothetical protein
VRRDRQELGDIEEREVQIAGKIRKSGGFSNIHLKHPIPWEGGLSWRPLAHP